LPSSQEDNAQGPILPEIAEILPEAHAARIKRPGVVNAWAYPDFRDAVLATGRHNLIMAGVTTDVCLIFPAGSKPNGDLISVRASSRPKTLLMPCEATGPSKTTFTGP
jgi:hypothetical protein